MVQDYDRAKSGFDDVNARNIENFIDKQSGLVLCLMSFAFKLPYCLIDVYRGHNLFEIKQSLRGKIYNETINQQYPIGCQGLEIFFEKINAELDGFETYLSWVKSDIRARNYFMNQSRLFVEGGTFSALSSYKSRLMRRNANVYSIYKIDLKDFEFDEWYYHQDERLWDFVKFIWTFIYGVGCLKDAKNERHFGLLSSDIYSKGAVVKAINEIKIEYESIVKLNPLTWLDVHCVEQSVWFVNYANKHSSEYDITYSKKLEPTPIDIKCKTHFIISRFDLDDVYKCKDFFTKAQNAWKRKRQHARAQSKGRKQYTYYLSEKIGSQLDDIKHKQGIDKSDLVEHALAYYIKRFYEENSK